MAIASAQRGGGGVGGAGVNAGGGDGGGDGGNGGKRGDKRKYANMDGKGKGESKNKGGKAKSYAQGCASETPDGKKICYTFNDKARGCAVAKCQFLHVCGRCFKDHPMFRCDA